MRRKRSITSEGENILDHQVRSNDELLRSPGRNIKLRIKHFAANSNELSQKAAQRVRSDKMRVREAI